MSVDIKRYTMLLLFIAICTGVPIYPIPSETDPESTIAHPAVLINSAMEDNLPDELRNNFYKNANIAANLAKESWFLNKEMQVLDRETDKIPRERIYSILHNAGLARK